MTEQDINSMVNSSLKEVNRRQFGDEFMEKRIENTGSGRISTMIHGLLLIFSVYIIIMSKDLAFLGWIYILYFIIRMVIITKLFNKDIEKFHILKKMNSTIDYEKINIDTTEFCICPYCNSKISIHQPTCPQCGAQNERYVKENVNDEYNKLHNVFEDMLAKEYSKDKK